METLIVGVDAGGTKTRAALYDQNGETLAEANASYGSMLVEPNSAMRHMGDAITDCLGARQSDARIYIGASGIHAGDNRARLTAYLRERFPHAYVRVEDDALLAMYAITHGSDSILVIAGTGSIAYGKRGADIRRAGGWGNVLGDEGSGYDISRRALVRITREYDSGGAYGPLSQRIMESLGTDVWGIVKFAHTAPKGEIAALLPLVEQTAEQGDAFAAGLLCEAGGALAALAEGLYGRMSFSGCIPVAVKGGVLEKIPAVRAEFVRRLDKTRFAVQSESAPSERGAFYLYLEERITGQ